jgi:hypothetical protein
LQKAAFLATLGDQVSKPVMPGDEPFEYLVTQAIADYLANLNKPSIDGMIYRSVQYGKTKRNVVLFHKAASVMPLDIPSQRSCATRKRSAASTEARRGIVSVGCAAPGGTRSVMRRAVADRRTTTEVASDGSATSVTSAAARRGNAALPVADSRTRPNHKLQPHGANPALRTISESLRTDQLIQTFQ